MVNKLYLAYSWDMDPGYMHNRLERNCQYVGKTYLKGYRLCFRGDSGKAKATLKEESGAVTPCVLYIINAKGEAILAAEFNGFEEKALPVSYCGFDTKASAFLMLPGSPLNPPGEKTVEIMRAAYKIQDISERLLDQAVQSSSI